MNLPNRRPARVLAEYGGGMNVRSVLARVKLTPGVAGLVLASTIAFVAYLVVGERLLVWLAPSPSGVVSHGYVWTLATGPLLEPTLLGLLLHLFVLWSFASTMEQFWGTSRFLTYVAATGMAGSVGGVVVGLALGQDALVLGSGPIIMALVIAFGVNYGKQQVQFMGAVPLTGRQLMYGFMALFGLLVVLEQQWLNAGALVGASLMGMLLLSRKYNPRVWWKRYQLRRMKAKLEVLAGGKAAPRRSKSNSLLN